MRLTTKTISYIVQNVAGSEAIEIVNFLKGKSNVSEFDIAESLKIDIKIVRILLYRLFKHNLVSSTRKKDKKKGWYIYYWTLNTEQLKHVFIDIQEHKLARFKERLVREQNNLFFICENNCIRLNFDQAVNFNFKCPECGSLMHQEDNKKKIEKIEKEIKLLEI
ncbi:MAG: hypothetical protein KAG56_03385 [Sulfurovaceae bacterium]|nr:hypothetical protein [Sulfurovaceae bacterium]